MTTTRRTTRWATSCLLAIIVMTTTGACGKEPAPDTAVPRLETTLSRVDDSLANRNWESARTALQTLIDEAQAALKDGTLGREQSDRIQAAAARLLSQLPAPPPQPPSPSPSPHDLDTTPDDEKEDEDEDKDEDKDEDD